MSQKKLKRVMRTGRLSPEQVARDETIRQQVQIEFPPLPPRLAPGSLSESLKKAIQESTKSVYQIALEAGVAQIVISRFLSGERDIRMATADRLADVLGLRVVRSVS